LVLAIELAFYWFIILLGTGIITFFSGNWFFDNNGVECRFDLNVKVFILYINLKRKINLLEKNFMVFLKKKLIRKYQIFYE